jgi:hypothetical protein
MEYNSVIPQKIINEREFEEKKEKKTENVLGIKKLLLLPLIWVFNPLMSS